MTDRFDPPAHLSDRAKHIWKSLAPKRARSVGRLALMQSALEAMDRADEARAAIATSTLTTTTKTTGAVHVHPLVKVEREARGQFAKIWSDLEFGYSRDEDAVSFQTWQRDQENEK